MDLVGEIYQITANFPDSEKFGLISQMRRCAVSIPSNIAEGGSRNTDKEFNNFLSIALGSAFELETQLLISVKLNFVEEEKIKQLLRELETVCKMIHSLKNKVSNV